MIETSPLGNKRWKTLQKGVIGEPIEIIKSVDHENAINMQRKGHSIILLMKNANFCLNNVSSY